MDYVAKTIEAYDNAPDKFVSATSDMTNIPEMQIMLKYLPNKGLPILDVGCGYGRDSQALHELGYQTISIDLSKALLLKAQTIHPELEFKLMDIRNLDFPDATFSGIWCNAILLHLNEADLVKALGEIWRVLMPNGVMAISVKEGEGTREVIETFSSNLARFYNFKTERALNDIVESCGFVVKQSHVLNERERFGPDKRDLNWVWSFAIKK